MPDDGLAARLVEEAVRSIGRTTETHYTHTPVIDDDAGIYDVDCSAYVGFLLGRVGERHYAMVAASTTHTRPLARDFYRFAAAQPPTAAGGWRRIERLADARPGDIVAWELPVRKRGDTGHVFVVATTAVPSTDGDGAFALAVYDSTSILHFDDKRAAGAATGIGSGVIHLRTGPEGEPTAFRFDPRTGFEDVPIAILRIEPFSAG